MQQLWDKARKSTEILRLRLQDLSSVESTVTPYIFLAESSLNKGDTVVRRGQVVVQRPSIILPPLSPQFEGFRFEEDLQISEQHLATFLLVRGVQFPSLRYRHETSSLDLYEGSLQQAVTHYLDRLKRAEDIGTGLVIGPEDVWQFSVLMLVGALVVRSADGDLRRILEQWRRRSRETDF